MVWKENLAPVRETHEDLAGHFRGTAATFLSKSLMPARETGELGTCEGNLQGLSKGVEHVVCLLALLLPFKHPVLNSSSVCLLLFFVEAWVHDLSRA